jgi:hypothetical protein
MLQPPRRRRELDGSSGARIYFIHWFHATAKLGWKCLHGDIQTRLKAMNLHLHHLGFSLHRVDKIENLLTVNCFLCLVRSTNV